MEAFLPITPPQNNTFTARVKSPVGAPSSTNYKNAGFSLLLYGYYAKTTLREIPIRDSLVHLGELENWELEQAHTSLPHLTMGHSRVGDDIPRPHGQSH